MTSTATRHRNGDYDLYYSTEAYFYGCKLGDTEPTRLFNWISCDVNGNNVNVLDVSDDGVVTGVITKYDMKTRSIDHELSP